MPTTRQTDKQQAMRAIEDQPDDCTMEELICELSFLRMIEQGTADSDAGRVLTEDQIKERIRSWQQSVGPKKPSVG